MVVRYSILSYPTVTAVKTSTPCIHLRKIPAKEKSSFVVTVTFFTYSLQKFTALTFNNKTIYLMNRIGGGLAVTQPLYCVLILLDP